MLGNFSRTFVPASLIGAAIDLRNAEQAQQEKGSLRAAG
jgi:hypothetical protein